ncbi:MAG: segregation/condensation protein A [Eubacteriales bacterium]|nr:segregation/condensation protein A [Eubacteriales bacterium]
MEKMQYKLESFNGPLDLLLHLITKNKVSIWDIPIVEITEQYLEAIEGIEDSALEDTSEFLVLAAQLLYIKSKMLLPKPETDEEEEDPREELARRLEEYKLFKEASASLRKNEFSSRYMFFKPEEKIEFPLPEYDRHHEVDELLDAFAAIIARKERRKKPEKRAFSGIVGREKVSVEDMVEKVCKYLAKTPKLNFKSVFKPDDSKPEMIATFLAILEMIKLNKIKAEYDNDRKDFVLTEC